MHFPIRINPLPAIHHPHLINIISAPLTGPAIRPQPIQLLLCINPQILRHRRGRHPGRLALHGRITAPMKPGLKSTGKPIHAVLQIHGRASGQWGSIEPHGSIQGRHQEISIHTGSGRIRNQGPYSRLMATPCGAIAVRLGFHKRVRFSGR